MSQYILLCPVQYLVGSIPYNLNYRYSWQEESKFPFSKVRLPPVKADPLGQAQLPDGMEVEVFSRAHENEENGWWTASIKMMKGEFAVVVYAGWDNNYTEIVSLERLRLKNQNPPISSKTFHHFEIVIPEEFRD